MNGYRGYQHLLRLGKPIHPISQIHLHLIGFITARNDIVVGIRTQTVIFGRHPAYERTRGNIKAQTYAHAYIIG